jgi:hypothetical protein
MMYRTAYTGKELLSCELLAIPAAAAAGITIKCTQNTGTTEITHSRQGPVLDVQITAPCLRPQLKTVE